jgi:hypothetical protein
MEYLLTPPVRELSKTVFKKSLNNNLQSSIAAPEKS